MMKETIKRTRSDAGLVRLSARDLFVLRFIADQSALCFDHLRALLGHYASNGVPVPTPHPLSETPTRRVIDRWLQLDLIEPPQKFLAARPSYVWLTPKGLLHLGLMYGYERPLSSQMLLHLDAVNVVRFHIQQTYQINLWMSKRHMLHELPAALRQASIPHTPDAELFFSRDITALEVIEERPDNFLTILSDLSAQYRHVWYYVHPSLFPFIQRTLHLFEEEKQKHASIHDHSSFQFFDLSTFQEIQLQEDSCYAKI